MVTLREFFESDDDGIDAPVPEIIVEMAEEELLQLEIPLNESQWIPSAEKGLWLRVDPPRPEMKQRRHVHIAQKKHIRASGEQASWNDDRTRHDYGRFNTQFGARADVQAVARSALGLSPNAVLEHLTSRAARLIVLLESENVPEANAVLLRTVIAGQLHTASA